VFVFQVFAFRVFRGRGPDSKPVADNSIVFLLVGSRPSAVFFLSIPIN
jgi:hypothetical protein